MQDILSEDREQSLSLHQRILNDIESRILSGEWQPGYRIPFEHELTEQYSCSRMTVNKALTQLAKAGMIVRKRGSGSFVSKPQSQTAVLEIQDIRAEVEQLGLPYRYELQKNIRRKSTASDSKKLDIERSTPLLELMCRHYAGKQVFALEERIINLLAVPDAAQTDFSKQSPSPWLVAYVPWSNAQHAIRAASADEAMAMALGIPRGAACLVIERQTWNAEQPITYVRLTYSGENHVLVARFSPSQA